MNLRIFQKFDPWGKERFVWKDKPGEAPAAPTGTPPAPTQTPEEAAAAAARQATAGAERAASSRRDEPGRDAAAEAILERGSGAASAQTPAAPTEAPETRTTPPTLKEVEKIAQKYSDQYLAYIKEKNPDKKREMLTALLASIPSDEKAVFEGFYESFLSITVKEQEEFRKKYFTDGKVNFETLENAVKNNTLTDREKIVLLSVLTQDDIDKLIEQKKLPAEMGLYFTQIQSVLPELQTRQKLARFDELVKDARFKDAYGNFINNPEKKEQAALRQEFIETFKDKKDQEIVRWALESAPTAVERQFVLKQKLKGTKLTPKEIDAQVKTDKLNFREGHIALALIEEKDVDQFTQAGKINPEEAAELRDMIRSRAPEAPGSEIPDSIKGLGIMGALEKLIDLLTKLADKISGAIDKMLKKKGPETQEKGFAKSPLGVDEKGGDKKIKLKRAYEKGKGVAIEAAKDAQIFAVEGGAVNVDGNVVTVTPPQSNVRIKYRNVKVAAGVTGQTVEAGKPIGTAGENGSVELQVFQQNEEKDPTALLEPYIMQEEAAPAVADASAPAAETPTVPAATSAGAAATNNPPNAPAQPPAAPAAAPAAKAKATMSATPQAPKKTVWERIKAVFTG